MADLQEFYKNAREKGIIDASVDYASFEQAMRDERQRQDFYQYATNEGLRIGTPERFGEYISTHLPQSAPQATGGVSGGSLLSEQEELARQNAIQGVTNDPNHPFVEGEKLRISDVQRPQDYDGDGSFYGLSDEDLNKQIGEYDQRRTAAQEALRQQQQNRKRSFAEQLAAIDNPALQPAQDQIEVNNVRLSDEDEERYARLQQEKVWRERNSESYQELGDAILETRKLVNSLRDQNGRNIDSGGASAYLDKAIELYQAPSKYGQQSGFKNWAEGLGAQLSDYDTYTLGVTEAFRAGNMAVIVKKLNKGEDLTDQEQVNLQSFLLLSMVEQAREQDLSTGYTIGKQSAESIPFMLEMLATAGLGAAGEKALVKSIVKSGNRHLAERVARMFGDEYMITAARKKSGKIVKDIALNRVEQGLLERGARQVGEDVLMTAAMPTTWASVNNDRVNEMLFSDDHDYGFMDFMRSFTSATLETGTERWGGKIVDKTLNKVMPLDKIWGKQKWGKLLSNDFIQSPFGETGEEYINAMANAIRSVNPAYSDKSNAQLREEAEQMFTPAGFAQTFLTVAPMSVFGGTVNLIVAKYKLSQYNNGKSQLTDLLTGLGASTEQAENIIRQIESSEDTSGFAGKVAETERILLYNYQVDHPNTTKEEYEAFKKQVDKTLGVYFKGAAYLNELTGELRDAYATMSEEDKQRCRDAWNEYVVAEFENKTPEETTEQEAQVSPAAAEYGRAVYEVTQAVQERTHGNGYIYPVAMPGNAEKTGYIVGEVVPVIDESNPEQLRIENDDIVTVKWSDGTVTQERARDLDLTGAPMMAQHAVDIEVENQMYAYTQQRIQNGEQPVLMRNGEGILEGFFPTEGGLLEDQNGVQYTPEQLAEQGWQKTKPVLFVNDQQQIAALDNGDGTYTQVDALGNPIAEPMSAEAFREQGFAMVPLEEEQQPLIEEKPEPLLNNEYPPTSSDKPEPLITNESQAPVQQPVQPANQTPQAAQAPAAPKIGANIPNIDSLPADELAAQTVSFMQSPKIARGYLLAERAKVNAQLEQLRKQEETGITDYTDAEDYRRKAQLLGTSIATLQAQLDKIDGAVTGIEEAEQASQARAKLTKQLKDRAAEFSKKLGVNIHVFESIDEVPNTQSIAKAKYAEVGDRLDAWVDTRTGEVYVNANAMDSLQKMDEKIFHEIVAHRGLRVLLGEANFNKLCDAVWESMSEADKKEFFAYAEANYGAISERDYQRKAADEYIAFLSEKYAALNINDQSAEANDIRTAWQKVCDMINSLLEKIFGTGFHVSAEDLANLIHASYVNLQREAQGAAKEQTEAQAPTDNRDMDENGYPFVKASDGTTTFGEIRETSGLPAAPIRLSQGFQGDNGKGYGLAHIEANHGEQIRNAGFNSVEEFVSFVAKNYDEDNIRVGKKSISGNTTYLIQVTDAHDNTLFIELSRDGSYWNVNSGGVFRKGYSNKKETVAKTEPQQPNNAVSSGSSLSAEATSGTASTEPNGEPTVSERKGTTNNPNTQISGQENAENVQNATDLAPEEGGTAADYLNEALQEVLSQSGDNLPNITIDENTIEDNPDSVEMTARLLVDGKPSDFSVTIFDQSLGARSGFDPVNMVKFYPREELDKWDWDLADRLAEEFNKTRIQESGLATVMDESDAVYFFNMQAALDFAEKARQEIAPTENRETSETPAEDLTPLEAAQKRKAAREAANAAEQAAQTQGESEMLTRLRELQEGEDQQAPQDYLHSLTDEQLEVLYKEVNALWDETRKEHNLSNLNDLQLREQHPDDWKQLLMRNRVGSEHSRRFDMQMTEQSIATRVPAESEELKRFDELNDAVERSSASRDGNFSALNNALSEYLSSLSYEQLASIYNEAVRLRDGELNISYRLKNAYKERSANMDNAGVFDYAIKQQGEIPAGKVNKPKTNVKDWVADKNDPRAALRGIYHDPSGVGVATNAHIMLVSPALYDASQKGKTIKPDGTEAEGRFPNWARVADGARRTDNREATVNWDAILGFIAGVKEKMKADGNPYKKGTIANLAFRMPDGQVVIYRMGTFLPFAEAAAEAGANTLHYSPIDGQTHVENNGTLALVMPVSPDTFKYDLDNERPTFYYDLSNGSTPSRGKTIDEYLQENGVDTSIPAMTEAQYFASVGLDFMGYSEPALHKGQPKTLRQRKKRTKTYHDSMVDFDQRREDARKEYQQKLAKGEIRIPTKIERLMETAKGHPDNQSVQSARRLLEKRGIDWESGTVNAETGSPMFSISDRKQVQFDLVQANNPMTDDVHTGIRSVEDIHTLEETLNDERLLVTEPDWEEEDIRRAVEDNQVTIYSSYPIENGVFVTPSRMTAEDYAGGGKVYEKTVTPDKVAWIASDEGQYADTDSGHVMFALVDEEDHQQEMDEIKAKAQADGTFMQAPNGQPTNLTERQWLQVRTRAFKRWFGDWENDPEDSSKVLDVNGEPMVAKHGTPFTFTTFDKSKQQQNDAGWLGRGFYFFTKNDDYAAGYARGGRVLNTFLNIREPYFATNEDMERLSELEDREESARFTQQLIDDGYDGVYFDGDLNGEYVAFSPNQIKSATDNDGSFSEENDDIRFAISNQNNDIFYSNAERAVEGIKQEKATPEQWRAMIEKAGGLKAGEDKWIGLSDWLAQQRPTVTPQANETRSQFVERAAAENKRFTLSKQDLLDYIREHKIQIEETEYQEEVLNGRDVYNLRDEIYDRAYDLMSDARERYYDIDNEEESMQEAYEDAMGELKADYGEDVEYYYNIEISGDSFSIVRTGTDRDFYEFALNYYHDANDEEDTDTNKEYSPINSTRLRYTTEGLENKREIALTVPTIESWNEDDEIHFGDAGPGKAIAWVRFGDATDEQGNKILVIDEIQSKRHQEGREHGYREDLTPLQRQIDDIQRQIDDAQRRKADLTRQIDDIKSRNGDIDEIIPLTLERSQVTLTRSRLIQEKIKLIEEKYEKNRIQQLQLRTPPVAPFEKNWHELAMKRILRFAAENGYDKVAWTTGDQQAARYNIGEVIDSITRNEDEDYPYSYSVMSKDHGELAYDFDENGIYHDDGDPELDGKSMSDVFGKELAKRLQEMPAGETIDNEGLRIGGEGMRGFYDDILPRFMQKYGKKWGVQVGKVTMPQLEEGYQTMHAIDINDAMRESVLEGQPMFSISGRGVNGTMKPQEGETRSQYIARVAETVKNMTPRNTTIDDAIRFSITVNHNSPYLLKRADGSFIDPETGERLGFDHRFMGKGEGGQAHGWGSYFSVNDIRTYANGGGITNEVTYKGEPFDFNGDWSKYDQDVLRLLSWFATSEYTQGYDVSTKDGMHQAVQFALQSYRWRYKTRYNDETIEALKYIDGLIDEIGDDVTVRPLFKHHYTVEIPDNTGSNYLEEGKMQVRALRKLIKVMTDEQKERLLEIPVARYAHNNEEIMPRTLDYLEDRIRYNTPDSWRDVYEVARVAAVTDKAASELLRKAGFVGIHYDGRRDGECYVIFDENDAVITDHIRFSVTGGENANKRNSTFTGNESDFDDQRKLPSATNEPEQPKSEPQFETAEQKAEREEIYPSYMSPKEILEKAIALNSQRMSPDAVILRHNVINNMRKLREQIRRLREAEAFEVGTITSEIEQGVRSRSVALRAEYEKSAKMITDIAKALFRGKVFQGMTDQDFSKMLTNIRDASTKFDLQKNIEIMEDIVQRVQGRYLRLSQEAVGQAASITLQRRNQSGVDIGKRVDPLHFVMISQFNALRNTNLTKINTTLADLNSQIKEEISDTELEILSAKIAGAERAKTYQEELNRLQTDLDKIDSDIAQLDKYVSRNELKGNKRKEFMEHRRSLMSERAELIDELILLNDNTVEQLSSITRDGHSKFLERIQQKQEHKIEILRMMARDLHGIRSDEGAKEEDKGGLKDNYLSPLRTFTHELRKFGTHSAGGEGYLYSYFAPLAHDARTNYLLHIRERMEILDNKARELFGEKATWNSVMKSVSNQLTEVEYKWRNVGADNTTVNSAGVQKSVKKPKVKYLTNGHIMYIYMVNKMTDGKAKLEQMGIDDATVAELKAKLPKELVQLADWLQEEYFPMTRKRYNETNIYLFDTPMAEIANYVPLKISGNAIDPKVDVGTGDMHMLPSNIVGNAISRTYNKKPIDIENTDAMDLVVQNMLTMEHWSAYAELITDLNTLLNSASFKNRIEQMNPNNYDNFFKTAQLAVDQYKPEVGPADKFVTGLTRFVATSKISLRWWPALKQSLSAISPLSEADPEFHKQYANAILHSKDSFQWALENLPIFRERWEGKQGGNEKLNIAEINSKSQSMQDMLEWAQENLVKYGISANAFVDAIVCANMAKAQYEAKKKYYTERGYSPEAVERLAKWKADEIYNETQQSSEGAYISAMQRDRTFIASSISLFNNSSMAYNRKNAEAIREAYKIAVRDKQEFIEFRKEQLMKDGIAEDQTAKFAEQDYKRARTHAIADMAINGYFIQFVWNVGGKAFKTLLFVLPSLFFGDDDEKKRAKEELLADLKKDAIVSGIQPIRGLPFGASAEAFLNVVYDRLSDEENRRYMSTNEIAGRASGNIHPAIQDVSKLLSTLTKDEVDKLNFASYLVNLATSTGTSVDAQTVANELWALEDVIERSFHGKLTWSDIRNDVAILLNVPPSQIEYMILQPRKNETRDEFVQRYTEYIKLKKYGWFTPVVKTDDVELSNSQEDRVYNAFYNY